MSARVEVVKAGEKGGQRFREDKAIKRWLSAKRPRYDDAERIISYRTEACVGFNNATAAGAPASVLSFLEREYEWARGRLLILRPGLIASLGGLA